MARSSQLIARRSQLAAFVLQLVPCRFLITFIQMSVMRKLIELIGIGFFFIVTGCSNHTATQTEVASVVDSATIDGHPAWIEQGNVYEVNTRQYTPEGT